MNTLRLAASLLFVALAGCGQPGDSVSTTQDSLHGGGGAGGSGGAFMCIAGTAICGVENGSYTLTVCESGPSGMYEDKYSCPFNCATGKNALGVERDFCACDPSQSGRTICSPGHDLWLCNDGRATYVETGHPCECNPGDVRCDDSLDRWVCASNGRWQSSGSCRLHL